MATKKKRSVTITGAWIGAIAIVVGAIISSLLPQVLEKTDAPAVQQTTKTPISFARYDDPEGYFSIEYPSNYHLLQMLIKTSSISVTFGEADDPSGYELLSVFIYQAEPGEALEEINKLLEKSSDYESPMQLLTSKKINMGHYIHLRATGSGFDEDYHFYYEQINDIVIHAFYMTAVMKLDESAIEYIFASLEWSYPKVSEAFK